VACKNNIPLFPQGESRGKGVNQKAVPLNVRIRPACKNNIPLSLRERARERGSNTRLNNKNSSNPPLIPE
jgi:hypothetical protein